MLNNKRHGNVIYSWSDGRKYKGGYKYFKFNGKGISIAKNYCKV